MLIAALPMYDLPELEAANDRLWAAIAARLHAAGVIQAPDELTRDAALDEIWSAPELLLSQTCGYPLVTALKGRVSLVATPCYRAPGCHGPFHRSAVIVRAADATAALSDLRGRRCAVNDMASNSGMNLLRAEIAEFAGATAFFSGVLVTGAHAASAEAVASGEADVAAIDCVTWAHLQRLRPATTQALRVLAWTRDSPGLPLITSSLTDEATCASLRQALQDVARDPSLEAVRAELLLDGFDTLSTRHYDLVLQIERAAASRGYAALC